MPGSPSKAAAKNSADLTALTDQVCDATPRQRCNPRPQRNHGGKLNRNFGGGKRKDRDERAPIYPRPRPQPQLLPSPDPNPHPPYTKVLIYPEESAKDAVTLTEEECDRLDEKEFLNDSLVDYELKRIQAEALQP